MTVRWSYQERNSRKRGMFEEEEKKMSVIA